jgi:hypothetical protein
VLIDQNWVQNNAGGMLLLENPAGSGSAALAQNNLANITTAPIRDGGSSAGGRARIARESS